MSDEKSVREKLTHKGLTGPWKRSPEIQRKSRDSCGDFATRMVWWREKKERPRRAKHSTLSMYGLNPWQSDT